MIAKEIADHERARRLTAYGTLYKALDRLESGGLLESRWEDPAAAASESRPRRRLYQVTVLGERELARANAERSKAPPGAKEGLAPS